MKQLFLCGGVPWNAADNNVLAYTLQSHKRNNLRVAFCAFARPEKERTTAEKDWENTFNRFSGDKKCAYRLMTSENFHEVSAWADVIHMPGGETELLMAELTKYADIDNLWDGKIISGSSAGADVMCSKFIFLQNKALGEGLGWVQATCIPHWGHYEGYTNKEDWEEIRDIALKRRPDLPVLCIPEGEFVEFAVQ